MSSTLNTPYHLLHLNDDDDGSESDFLYYNSLAVIENQSIPSQVREANSNVKED